MLCTVSCLVTVTVFVVTGTVPNEIETAAGSLLE